MENNYNSSRNTIIYAVYIISFIAVVALSGFAIVQLRYLQSSTYDSIYGTLILLTYIIFGAFIAAERPISKNVAKIPKLIIRIVAAVTLISLFYLPYYFISFFGSALHFFNHVHIFISAGYLAGAAIIDFIMEKSDKTE